MDSKEANPRIKERIIEDEMQQSYIDYSMSVIVGRALPDVRDGLKPVQRRVLYSMLGLGLQHNRQFRKSARVIGECFAKNTLVLTEKGLMPIQNIQREDKVYTQKGLEKVNEIYIMPKKTLLKITLENGVESTVTKSQKFKVLTEDWKFIWKEVKDIKSEDYIIVRSFYPEIRSMLLIGNKHLNENIAYLLGILISDGWVEKNRRVGFYSTSKGIMSKIKQILEIEFGYSPKIEEKNYEYETITGQFLLNKGFQVRINKKNINEYLINNFGLIGIKAENKKIPLQIFQSPKTVIFSFISGLIDGDGCIHKERNVIHYGTISKELANQLLVLMQHFDIHGTKYITEPDNEELISYGGINSRKDFINIEFRGDCAQRLGCELKLFDESNSLKRNSLLMQQCGKSNYELLPHGSMKIFKELSERHLGGGWYKDASGNKFRAGVKYVSGSKIRYSSDLYDKPLRISQIIDWGIRNKMEKLGSNIYKFLEEIILHKIYFIKVNRIEEAEEDETYDIQVENTHEFIANGMVSHNCLGKYHPHSDTAVYDAMVRMAQDFSLRYPLVDGQGNWGSIDGDNAAALRYTEARLTALSEEILSDIDKETVDFVPNFDNTLTEPLVLPSKAPNLLINGCSGIAVGMATNIPPHNFGEVVDGMLAFIDDNNLNADDLFRYIHGPDFPTGAIICGTEGIRNAYNTGRGIIRIRSKTSVDEHKHQIIVSEVPFQINKSQLVEEIARLVNEKKVNGISDLRDESDRDGIRVVIVLKRDADAGVVLNQLFKHSRLESTFGINMVALVNNQPRLLNLRDMIKCFVGHRKDVVTRRTSFELKKATERVHILEGVIAALNRIDDVIGWIRKSASVDDAKIILIQNLSLTDIQAQAILDMRLQRLASLEQEKIRKESEDLKRIIVELKAILADERRVLDIIKKELLELKQKYADERRTFIEGNVVDYNRENLIQPSDVFVTITHKGYVKRIEPDVYKTQRRGGKGVIATETREEDFVEDIFIANTRSYLLLFTNTGIVHWLKVYEIPEASRYALGMPLANLVNMDKDEKITAVVSVDSFENRFLLMATMKGVVKRVQLDSFSRPRSGGIIATTLDEGDTLVGVCVTDGSREVVLATSKGMAVRFKEADVRAVGRSARGIRGIRLGHDDVVVAMVVADSNKTILSVTENGYGKRSRVEDYRLTRRGGKGVINIKTKGRNGNVVDVKAVVDDDTLMFISKQGIAIKVGAKNISVVGRNTQGVRLMRLNEGDKLVAAAEVKD